ncbi:hypothetical protein EXE46_03960 [Halorubrum sp. GN11_10-6_MGM]|uniref:DUF5810 domain-containing protein n=1 Tax=Halorubrum sp. GN11_10-6_MGM TaxID=2518112 RepID=UPI0010FA0E89|nr:DUF5810 domain-containing protein [Halorubrum sp. GN11_10-6_MGM]TKX75316.1 hypothetical protein EXE46_03960 [Halorubrum sp. GN11_10-6_MGM]
MGYACPVCDTPQRDGEHLAHHLAFTAMLHGGDHEAWLDERVADWSDREPADLAAEVTPHADEAEYEEVFEDTVPRGRPDVGMGSGGHAASSTPDHGGHDHAGHDHDSPADAGMPTPEQVDDPAVAEALREAREMTREATDEATDADAADAADEVPADADSPDDSDAADADADLADEAADRDA